jgi:hypothetical protein
MRRRYSSGEDMIADQTELFRSLKDAEDWLVEQGFRLQPNSCDWRNAAGDDAGCYVNLRGPYDTAVGFRVEIKRRDQEVAPDERGEALLWLLAGAGTLGSNS